MLKHVSLCVTNPYKLQSLLITLMHSMWVHQVWRREEEEGRKTLPISHNQNPTGTLTPSFPSVWYVHTCCTHTNLTSRKATTHISKTNILLIQHTKFWENNAVFCIALWTGNFSGAVSTLLLIDPTLEAHLMNPTVRTSTATGLYPWSISVVIFRCKANPACSKQIIKLVLKCNLQFYFSLVGAEKNNLFFFLTLWSTIYICNW